VTSSSARTHLLGDEDEREVGAEGEGGGEGEEEEEKDGREEVGGVNRSLSLVAG
jgi:hypothetical protein